MRLACINKSILSNRTVRLSFATTILKSITNMRKSRFFELDLVTHMTKNDSSDPDM